MNQFVAKKQASAVAYRSWKAAWRECEWAWTSCQCQGGSSCDSGGLALISSTLIWGPASQLTPVLNTGVYIYLDMNEAWSSCSHYQGGSLFRKLCWQELNVWVKKGFFKSQNERSFTGWKSMLHNASPQKKCGGVGIPSGGFGLPRAHKVSHFLQNWRVLEGSGRIA